MTDPDVEASSPAGDEGGANYDASAITGSAVAMGTNARATLSVTNVFPERGALREQRALSELGNRVHNSWIVGVLETSTGPRLPRMQMQVEYTNAAHVSIQSKSDSQQVSAEALYDLFNRASHAMVILGAPGSGKTYTALELVHHWLTLADTDVKLPIPVVLSLSSWTRKQPDLSKWIVDELNRRYAIPLKIGRQWLTDQDIGLVLDGLDELLEEDRPRCAEEIERFRREQGLNWVVVVSRVDTFEGLAVSVPVGAVVKLQPPSLADVEAHLEGLPSEGAKSLLAAIQTTEWIRDLAVNPLMLGLLLQVQTPSLATTDSDRTNSSQSEPRERVFEAYVDQMFKTKSPRLARARIERVLEWLASGMAAHGQSEFLVEWLQPRWLDPSRRAYDVMWAATQGGLQAFALTPVLMWLGYHAMHNWLQWAAPLVFALVNAMLRGTLALLRMGSRVINVSVCGIASGTVAVLLFRSPKDDFWAFLAAPATTFTLMAVTLLTVRRPRRADVEIEPVGAVTWAWSAAAPAAGFAILASAALALLGCYLVGNVTIRNFVPWFATTGVALVPGCAILAGLQPPQLLDVQSNRALFRSASTYAIVVISCVLTALALFSFYISQNHRTPHLEKNALRFLMSGVGVGLALGLRWGGTPFVQHVLLRFVLAMKRAAPWRFTPVLDQAVALALLRRVGNGYIFVHRSLLEHFARRKAPAPIPTSTTRTP